MNRPLEIAKLESSEDEGTQAQLDRLAVADAVAVDILISGDAFPDTCEHWVRLDEASRRLAGTDKYARREWAYYIGVAVGLRVARMKVETAGGAR